MLLVDVLVAAFRAAVYVLISLMVRMHALWRAAAALFSQAAARLAAAAPAVRPVLSALFALPPREHIGSRPRPPAVLGVAIAEEVAEAHWPAAVQALGRVLAWAHDQGFVLVFLYEPGSHLQQPSQLRLLELQLLQQRLHGTVQLQVGWQPQGEAAAAEAAAAAAAARAPEQTPNRSRRLQAVLLAAGDGEWPLQAAAAAHQAGAARSEDSAGETEGRDSSAAAIDAAIEAPARVRQRLQAAAGPLAGVEPDFVLVTGPALSLAGFPAWAVRASEIYGIGPLACLQDTAELDAALRRFCGTKQRWGK